MKARRQLAPGAAARRRGDGGWLGAGFAVLLTNLGPLRARLPLVVATFLIASHAIAAAPVGEAILADGEAFRGALGGIGPGWNLRFDVAGAAPRELPAADLIRWGEFVEKSAGPQVLLADGGLIVADVRQIDREKLALESDLLGSVALPLDVVPAVLFHPPSDRHRRDQLVRRLLSAGGESDRVLLDNGDELSGTLAALHDDVATLETDTGKIEVELARIAALVFNPTLARRSESRSQRALVCLRDGSRLLATGLETAGTKTNLQLPEGVRLAAETDAIVALQPLGGRAVYLSDLKPAGYKHIPFLQLAWPYETDRNVSADLLRAGGKLRLKGLGMHSACATDLQPGSRLSPPGRRSGHRRRRGRLRQRGVSRLRRRRQRPLAAQVHQRHRAGRSAPGTHVGRCQRSQTGQPAGRIRRPGR